MRSEEMRATIQKHAERIAGTSGGTVETYVAQTRAVAEEQETTETTAY